MTRDGKAPARKRHHFVPVTYLRSWTGEDGRLYAYHADQAGTPLHVRPEETGFENYYYSQVRPDGTRDNDSFEELFGRTETHWPMVLAGLDARRFEPGDLTTLYRMATMLRARVPAARDYQEALMALETRTNLKVFAELGKLPAKLRRYEDELDTVEVTVERSRTLGTMGADMRRFGDLTRRLGFEILCNETGVDFISSDNPVAYYDPTDPGIRHPYINNTRIELLFPVSARHVLRGSTALVRHGHAARFRALRDPARVRAINRTTARYAYRLAFARDRSTDALIDRHRATSPVLNAQVVRKPGEVQYHIGHKFGPRPALPKFRPERCEDDLYEEDFDL